MWVIIKDEKVDQIITGTKGVEIDGVQHPKSIFTLWSKEELCKIGIVPYLTEDNGDSIFQYQSGYADTISSDGTKVVKTIQYTDRELTDLKTAHKDDTNSEANTLLNPTDWHIIKKIETGTDVPSSITTYRSAVRTSANKIETLINDCDTLDKFKALFVVPTDSDGKATGKAPIRDWPEL